MKQDKKTKKTVSFLLGLFILFGVVLISLTSLPFFVEATPVGPIIYNYSTESSTVSTAPRAITTPRSTVTTMLLDLSTAQSQKWKAYVGNVTGSIVLADADNYSIYEWQLLSYTGEVYATRQATVINWATINCSNVTHLADEDTTLSLSSSDSDSVVSTFNKSTVHSSITVGIRELGGCFAIRTFNESGQQSESVNAQFQEVLLNDGSDNVYATHISENATGFDNKTYDFQLVVPEATSGAPNSYYFYLELD